MISTHFKKISHIIVIKSVYGSKPDVTLMNVYTL